MKSFVCVLFIFFLLNCSLKAQWYTKQYGVNDIGTLTNEQLNESFQKYKSETLSGGLSIGVGCLSILAANTTYKNGLPEDATLGEQILGSRAMKGFYNVLGIGLISTGLIMLNVGISRSHSIKKVMTDSQRQATSISLKPVYINLNGSSNLGLNISYSF